MAAALARGDVIDYMDAALCVVEEGGFGAGVARRRLKRITVGERSLCEQRGLGAEAGGVRVMSTAYPRRLL